MSKCLLSGLLCQCTVHKSECQVLSLSTICHRRTQSFHAGLGFCVIKVLQPSSIDVWIFPKRGHEGGPTGQWQRRFWKLTLHAFLRLTNHCTCPHVVISTHLVVLVG